MSGKLIGPVETYTTDKRITRYRCAVLSLGGYAYLAHATIADARRFRKAMIDSGYVAVSAVQLTALIEFLKEQKADAGSLHEEEGGAQ